MNYSTNYNLNKPERSEQFNLDHWNNNTDVIDTQMHINKVNIAQNATDIATLFTGLNTKNTSDTNSVFYKLMKLIYPVGSLYWSANNTNPSTLFGGTWVQIKDRFVLACGDTYKTVGATGGASSVTLSVSNMPNHTHSFTPSGTVSSHSHPINSGNTSSAGTKTTAGIRHSGSTGGMSKNSTGSINFSLSNSTSASQGISVQGNMSSSGDLNSGMFEYYSHTHSISKITLDVSHTHTLPSSYIYGSTDNATPTFSGIAGTTGSNGSGTAFSILPPYVVKYCFERTA